MKIEVLLIMVFQLWYQFFYFLKNVDRNLLILRKFKNLLILDYHPNRLMFHHSIGGNMKNNKNILIIIT